METEEVVPVTTENTENSTIKQMREQIESASKAKKDLERQFNEVQNKLKEREDLELSETDKLKRENDELKPFKTTHDKFAAKMESFYNEELSSVPDDKREHVEKLSKNGDWADRLEAIKAVKALLNSNPAAPAKVEPTQMGSPTAPAARSNILEQKAKNDPTKMSWADALKSSK